MDMVTWCWQIGCFRTIEKNIIRIHSECGMNTIAMIKKSSKVFYEFEWGPNV